MKIALALPDLSHEGLAYTAQLGVGEVILGGTGITYDLKWDFASLLRTKSRVESYGLHIAAIENLPEPMWHDVRVGGPERERQLEAALEVIRNLGRVGIPIFQGKISFAHFRNVRGRFPKFDETFQDDGDTDQLEAVRAYLECGFEGPIRPDHSPAITGDRDGHVGMAFSVGYLRGLIQAVERHG